MTNDLIGKENGENGAFYANFACSETLILFREEGCSYSINSKREWSPF